VITKLKDSFISSINTYKELEKEITYLIVAVKLPTGAIELITNNQNIIDKAEYYTNAYDDDFKLKSNPDIQIINYMIV
jgi:hypothetical protein